MKHDAILMSEEMEVLGTGVEVRALEPHAQRPAVEIFPEVNREDLKKIEGTLS